MVRVRSWVPVLVVVMVGSGGLVGCSGGAGAGASPSVDPYEVGASAMAAAASASASARASRDAALGPDLVARRDAALATPPPDKPENLGEDSLEAAAAAAVYFFSLYRYAAVTGDTKDFEAMSEQRCKFCADLVDKTTRLHQEGGWADPWEQTAEKVEAYPLNPGYEYHQVDVTLFMGDITTCEGNSPDTKTTPAETEKLHVALRYHDGTWTVGGVEVVKP